MIVETFQGLSLKSLHDHEKLKVHIDGRAPTGTLPHPSG